MRRGGVMRVKIKICCVTSPQEAALAVDAGANMLGLVGRMPSGPGVIDDATIKAIARDLPAPVEAVLLTSEITAHTIAQHALRCGVTTVQIVNPIDPIHHAELHRVWPALNLIQVVHVDGEKTFEAIARYRHHVQAFLLDSGRPNATIPELGGTGRTHDWSISAEFVARSDRPVFLAGGLTPENVAEANAQVRPHGVDVCSGVRLNNGLQAQKLSAFVSATHRGAGVT
jgi:phosphoribosylanthranilate isomerase